MPVRSVGAVPDAIFADPRLAAVYDPLDPDRSDLDVYAALVEEFGARSVLDIGCGTGTFACLLARRGLAVTGIDPAAASLDVARRKPGAERVRWLHGDAATLPPLQVDAVTMTANVAQVFCADEDWAVALGAACAALRPGGRLVFESRVPERRAWLEWDREHSVTRAVLPDGSPVESWVELIEVRGSLVTFRSFFFFAADGTTLTSESTLRFRTRDELARSVTHAGFVIDEIRDAPDRPGREYVFLARRGG